MGWFSNNSKERKLNWERLNSPEDLDALIEKPDKLVVIFKHSTRCAISSMALNSFESEFTISEDKVYLGFIDLVNNRDVSSECAEKTGIRHESPQLIILDNGKVVHHSSHGAIQFNQLAKLL